MDYNHLLEQVKEKYIVKLIFSYVEKQCNNCYNYYVYDRNIYECKKCDIFLCNNCTNICYNCGKKECPDCYADNNGILVPKYISVPYSSCEECGKKTCKNCLIKHIYVCNKYKYDMLLCKYCYYYYYQHN